MPATLDRPMHSRAAAKTLDNLTAAEIDAVLARLRAGKPGLLDRASASQIASTSNIVNRVGKDAGRQVWDMTNGRMMVATGPLPTSTWRVADGSATVTPAAVTMDLDFANERYVGSTFGISGGANGWVQNKAGVYVPGRRSDKGQLFEPADFNRVRNTAFQGLVLGSPGQLPTYCSSADIGLTRTVLRTGFSEGFETFDVQWKGTTTGQFGGLYFEAANGYIATPGTAYAGALTMALIDGSWNNIIGKGFVLAFLNSGGSTVGTGGSTGAQVSDFMQRQSGTSVAPANTAYARPSFYFNGSASSGVAVDFTVRLSVPHINAGTVATSPIRTEGAAVGRSADAGAIVIPAGTTQLVACFDDGSEQTLAVSPGAYAIPTNLNRAHVAGLIGKA